MNSERTLDGETGRLQRARAFAALGDPVRLGIVELLGVQDLSPQAIGAAVELPSNLLAHHLKVLEEAGLIARHQSEGDRRRAYWNLVPEAMESLFTPLQIIRAPRVVFVCTQNSARSVLAESLWNQASTVPATSAGTHPAPKLNPRTARAAARAGLTLHTSTPRSIEGLLASGDLIVSVCDSVNEEIQGLPNARIHWSVPDPALPDNDAAFDQAITELSERIRRLAPLVQG